MKRDDSIGTDKNTNVFSSKSKSKIPKNTVHIEKTEKINVREISFDKNAVVQ